MRIHPPRLMVDDRRERLEAQIESGSAGVALPESLWFEVDRGAGETVLRNGAEPFVTLLLPVAMALGEDLRVEAPLSPRLADGLRSWQQVVTRWWPDRFQSVSVHSEGFESVDAVPGRGVGCFFSGGVDSFFSVWQHLLSREEIPGSAVTHAVMVLGFDKDDDETLFAQMRAIYEPMLRELGVEPLTLRTNGKVVRRATMTPQQIVASFGSFLGGCAHAMAGRFGRMLIASSGSYAYCDMHPFGSHPVLDHHLGSEGLQIVHDGARATRSEKISALVDVPETRKRLRVCEGAASFDIASGLVRNCCRCVKCRRTMISLEILGVLGEYAAFPEPLHRKHIRRMWGGGEEIVFIRDNLELARRLGRSDRVRDLTAAVWWNRLVQPIRRFR